MLKLIFPLGLLLCVSLSFLSGQPAKGAALSEDLHSGVILTYYRIGEDNYGDSSLPAEEFLAQVAEMEDGSYHVVSLRTLLDSFKTNRTLPDHPLVITFQGAYKSALTHAIPELLAKKIPFTIFYSAMQADSNSGDMMNWEDLKNLSRNDNVTLGILPDGWDRDSDETDRKRQLNNALLQYRKNFNGSPQFFAYPAGEYSQTLKVLVKNTGFEAAFGLQSGVAFAGSDVYALPRFSMTDPYGDLDRFHLVAGALPFPVTDLQPSDSYIDDSMLVGFSVPSSLQKDLGSLSCFASGQKKPKIEIIGTRVELRESESWDDDRVRINCTLPSGLKSDDGPQWRWLGFLLVKKSAS